MEAFVKKEFVNPGKFCHLIGARNDAMQCLFGPSIAALGDIICQIPGMRTIMADSVKKGQCITECIYGSVNVLEVDYTAWDSTLSVFDLELTHYVYKQLFHGFPRIAEVLAKHTVSCWSYSNGCRYTLTGTRVSGDSDTTVGNSILHWIYNVALLEEITHAYAPWTSCHHFEVAGDDGVLGLPVESIDLEELVHAGKKIKAVYRADPHDTQFCSGVVMPCEVDGKVVDRLYRLPGRTVGRIGFAPDPVPERAIGAVLADRALAEVYACSGCPITSALANNLHRYGVENCQSRWKTDRDVQRRLRLEQSVPLCQSVLPITRSRFAYLFDIAASAQRRLERILAVKVCPRPYHNSLLNLIATEHN